jgi:phosphoglycolate phosphatase-like HAD superfamily hydrolase
MVEPVAVRALLFDVDGTLLLTGGRFRASAISACPSRELKMSL